MEILFEKNGFSLKKDGDELSLFEPEGFGIPKGGYTSLSSDSPESRNALLCRAIRKERERGEKNRGRA